MPAPKFGLNLKKPGTVAAPVAPAPVAEPVVEAPEAAEAVEEAAVETQIFDGETEEMTEEKVKRPRKPRDPNKPYAPPAPPLTDEKIEFIVANAKTMSYKQMAEACQCTVHQVNRTLMTIKTQMREAAEASGDPEYIAAVEKHIAETLARPANAGIEAMGRSSAVKDKLTDITQSILAKIKK